MKDKGFTLIEVLVALAILGIAMTAIIKSTSQNIKDTQYIQQKTIAVWVGNYIINQVRAGILNAPKAPDELSDEIESLGSTWLWKTNLIATPNPKINEIHVNIYRKDDEENALSSLVSYSYAP